MDAQENESKRLRQDVEWALRSALDPGDVLPLLHRLTRTAAPGTDESVFAHRQLAELLAERHPWRAALHARKVLGFIPEDDRAWAVLGLCQTLLGNYKYAARAYFRALNAAPQNPWYAHNLGHLLDVALGRAEDAVLWLETAYQGAMGNREIAASFAHALARAGKLGEAKRVLSRAMRKGVSREQAALWKWLEAGAPPEQDAASCAARIPFQARPATELSGAARRRRSRKRSDEALAELETALARGLENLPLDARQRARARVLSRDPAVRRMADEGHNVQTLAAALAYAIVYVDHVPLTQAEVAASFRVSGASLRGRFGVLRSELHLAPGDARYRRR